MTEMEKGGGECKSATANKGNDERRVRQDEESSVWKLREEERWVGSYKKQKNKTERNRGLDTKLADGDPW